MSSCATPSVIIEKGYEPEIVQSYIIGKFIYDGSSLRKISLEIENLETGDEYSFFFESDEEKQYKMIEVPPGEYAFKKMALVSPINEILDFTRYDDATPFVLEQNQAVNLGELLGTVKGSSYSTHYSIIINSEDDVCSLIESFFITNYDFLENIEIFPM